MKRVTLLAMAFCAFLFPSCKIVKNDTTAKQGAGELEIFFSNSGFDPKAYVASIWDSKVLPYVGEKSGDMSEILSGIKSAKDATAKKYGYRVGDEGTFYNYAARGKVKITRVDTESRNGYAYGDLPPYDGKEDVSIQIGPVYKGSSIRDFLSFISLNNFENQVEFAKLAGELNAKVRDTVIGTTDPATMVGKTYEMTAVFTDDGSGELPVMTPVVLTAE